MTLGAWSYRMWRRLPLSALALYGVLELVVAAWALLLFFFFDELIPFFVPLLRLGLDRFWLMQLLRLLIAAFWILPPTIMMGATFPAIVAALEGFDLSAGRARRAIAWAYSVNLLGAVAGAGVGPYLLFARWGLDAALLLSAAIDLVVGVIAIALSRRSDLRRESREESVAPQELPFSPKAAAWVLLAAATASGFFFFGLEVLWTHLISVVFGNSIYAFSTVLAVVLLGLFFGGALAAWLYPSRTALSPAIPGGFLLIGSLFLAAQFLMWSHIPHQFTVFGSQMTRFAEGEMLRWGLALFLMLPATVTLGAVYPLLFRLRMFPDHQQALMASRMTALNAVGSIAGALIMGFVLIPVIGSEASLLGATMGYALLGTAYCFLTRSRPLRMGAGVVAASLLVLIGLLPPWDRLALTSGEHVYFRPAFVGPQTLLRFFHEDPAGGMTTVVENPISDGNGRARVLLTNGKFQGNDQAEQEAQIGFALIPALHVPQLDRALVIGFGTGQSAQVVEALGFQRIDIAEIAPGILEAAEYFHSVNRGVLRNPSVRTYVEDGRNLLLLRPGKYDLVTMEISSVWFAGATNLYSEEFYRLARSRLKSHGILQQWIQLHHIGERELASTVLTMRRVFSYVSFWVVGGQGLIVGSEKPQVVRAAALRKVLEDPEAVGWSGPQVRLARLFGSRLLSPDDVTRMAEQLPVAGNTDRNRRLEYLTPRYNLSRIDHSRLNVEFLLTFARPSPHQVSPEALPLLKEGSPAIR